MKAQRLNRLAAIAVALLVAVLLLARGVAAGGLDLAFGVVMAMCLTGIAWFLWRPH